MEQRIINALKYSREKGIVKPLEPVIAVTGWKSGENCTNTIRLVYMPDGDDFKMLHLPKLDLYLGAGED